MKKRVSEIRGSSRGGRAHEKYLSQDDAEKLIASRDGDDVASFDVIDETSGEVYVEAGQPFNVSPFSPDHKIDKMRAERDEEYAKRVDLWDEFHKPEPEEDDDWEDPRAVAEREYREALEEFCSNYIGFAEDHAADYGDSASDPSDIAPDAASGFFSEYTQWRSWARAMQMSRSDMQAMIADHVYEAMMKKTNESVKLLAALLSEAVYPTRASAVAYIAGMSPGDIAAEDVLDDETGETHVVAGQKYRHSSSHPDYAPPRSRLSPTEFEQASDCSDSASSCSPDVAFEELAAALRDYAVSGANDAAGFFADPRWRSWSTATGISRQEMSHMVTDAIAEAVA